MEHAIKDCAQQGIKYLLSFSATPIIYQSQLRNGWRLIGHYEDIKLDRDTSCQLDPAIIEQLQDGTITVQDSQRW